MWKRKDEILEPLDCIKDHINRELLFVCAFMHHDDGEVDVINRMLIGRFLPPTRLYPTVMTITICRRRRSHMPYLKA